MQNSKQTPNTDHRIKLILAMRRDERSYEYIGRRLGLTKQRVHQILKAHEAKQSAEITDDK